MKEYDFNNYTYDFDKKLNSLLEIPTFNYEGFLDTSPIQGLGAEYFESLSALGEKQHQELTNQTEILLKYCSQLNDTNKMLTNQYRELYGIYQHLQDESAENKKELVKSKRFNCISMVIAIIAVVVSVCAWLFPEILGG